MDKRADNKTSKDSAMEQLSAFLNHSGDLFYRYNLLADRYDYVSDSIEKLTGYPASDFLDKSASAGFRIMHPDDVPRMKELREGLISNLLQTIDVVLEYRIIHRQGQVVWLSDNVHGIHDENGRLISCIGVAKDITAMKELESHVEETREMTRLLCAQLPVGYFRTRYEDGKLLECNEVAWRVFGYDSKEQCMQNFATPLYCDNTTHKYMLSKLHEDGQVKGKQLQFQLSNGRTIWLEVSAKYFRSEGYVEGIFRDISILKLLTSSEIKVLRLVLEGKCNKEIAHLLHRSVRTIEDHRSHIMQKLQVANIVELVQKVGIVGFNAGGPTG